MQAHLLPDAPARACTRARNSRLPHPAQPPTCWDLPRWDLELSPSAHMRPTKATPEAFNWLYPDTRYHLPRWNRPIRRHTNTPLRSERDWSSPLARRYAEGLTAEWETRRCAGQTGNLVLLVRMWCGRPGLLYQFRNSTTGHNVDLSRAWVGRLQQRNFSMLLLFLLFEFTRCFHHSLFGHRNEKKDCGTTDRRYSKTWATKEVLKECKSWNTSNIALAVMMITQMPVSIMTPYARLQCSTTR